MDLKSLNEWAKQMLDTEKLRQTVRKDARGVTKDSDITVCINLLNELRRRISFVFEHTKKAQKYEMDIMEYLGTLERRGVVFEQTKETVQKDAKNKPGQS